MIKVVSLSFILDFRIDIYRYDIKLLEIPVGSLQDSVILSSEFQSVSSDYDLFSVRSPPQFKHPSVYVDVNILLAYPKVEVQLSPLV